MYLIFFELVKSVAHTLLHTSNMNVRANAEEGYPLDDYDKSLTLSHPLFLNQHETSRQDWACFCNKQSKCKCLCLFNIITFDSLLIWLRNSCGQTATRNLCIDIKLCSCLIICSMVTLLVSHSRLSQCTNNCSWPSSLSDVSNVTLWCAGHLTQ